MYHCRGKSGRFCGFIFLFQRWSANLNSVQSLTSSTQGWKGKLSIELNTNSFGVFLGACWGRMQCHFSGPWWPTGSALSGGIQGSWISLGNQLQFSAAVGQPCPPESLHIFVFRPVSCFHFILFPFLLRGQVTTLGVPFSGHHPILCSSLQQLPEPPPSWESVSHFPQTWLMSCTVGITET